MRKIVLFVVGSLVIVPIAGGFYLWWAKYTFVSREIKRLANSQEVHVISQAHTDHQWYGKAEIDQQSGRRLFARDKWEQGFDKKVALAGKLVSDVPPDCSKCFYRIEMNPHDRQFHPYNYSVYILSSDMKVLEVYQQFGS